MTNAHHFRGDSPGLPEFTRRSLESFHRRRQHLSLVRGASSVMVLFTVLLLLAVAIDAWWLHELAPWIGSVALYIGLATGLTVWCCLPKLRAVDLLSEARRLERMDPRLREKLVPAVELSVAQPGVVDSIVFRQQLQTQVAYLLQTVDPRHLLPWTLLQRQATVAAGGAGLLLLLCLVPGLYFPQRMVRILLPFGDWGRVSRIAISLERPVPHSQLVPRDDLVAIRARIVGPRPAKVSLETRVLDPTTNTFQRTGESAAKFEMNLLNRPVGSRRLPFQSDTSRFEYLWPATNPLMEYRVSSQGASTPWYRLSTLPRPHVIEFERRIAPPVAATQLNAQFPPDNSPGNLPTVVSVAEHGHLQVLTGSHVELRLRVDQATRSAELRWEASATPADIAPADAAPAGNSSAVGATKDVASTQESGNAGVLSLRTGDSPQHLTVDFTVTHSTDYRIYLQSLQSGFTNEFSPRYHIQAVADQAPEITWQTPHVTQLLATSHDVIRFENQIVDEFALAKLTRSIRINGSQWEAHPLPAVQPASQPSQALRHATSLEWELDLFSMDLKAGDNLEVKLTATDRRGQSAESAVVSIDVASAKLADAPPAGVLLRREVAAALERITHKMSLVNTHLDAMLIPAAKNEPSSDMALQFNSVLRSTRELQQELTDTWAVMERAVGQSEDALNSQTLIHVGEALLAISASTRQALPRLEKLSTRSERAQTAPGLLDVRLQLDADHNRIRDVSQHFAAITSHDVLSHYAAHLSLLAQAEVVLSDSPNGDDEASQQLQRRQRVLTEQLRQTQQAMLEALPLVREATRPLLQNTAMQLGQQIAVAENFSAVSPSSFSSELAGSLAEQLDQMRLPTRLDKSLPAAANIALRRLREMAPPAAHCLEQLGRVIQGKLPLETHWPTFREQLIQRRNWERAAPQGDRLYASDLGKTLRAAQTLDSPIVYDTQSAISTAQTLMEAIEILQGIHHVYQADKLLLELIENERPGSTDRLLGWHGPRQWYAIEQRLHQGVNALRTAKLPATSLDAIDELLHTPAAQWAAQVLTERIWNTEPPPPVIAELEDLRRKLRPLLLELDVHARGARQVLDRIAPTISQLAQRAADNVRQVEQQSTQLAEAINREEVPDLSARRSQLASQAELLHEPIDHLRQALIEQADAQDLLDRQQMQLARQADAARQVVEVVDAQLERARTDTMQTLSTKQSSASLQSAQLHSAATVQADSAAALEQLAEHFQNLENQQQMPTAEQLSAGLNELQQQRNNLNDSKSEPADTAASAPDDDPYAEPYAQAEQLADLAALDPQTALEQLERELPTNISMAEEMSQIARQAAQQSLQQLEQAAQQQTALSNAIELSDANFKAQKEMLLHDLQIVSQSTERMIDTLTSEAQWTADASKNRQAAKQIAETEAALGESIKQLQELSLDHPFDQLRSAASAMQSRLSLTQQELSETARELIKASFEEFHQSGAELANRRREMRDRQRRIQQESVRDGQTLERSQVHRAEQVAGELQQLTQGIQRTEAQLLTVSRAADEDVEVTSQLPAARSSLANKKNELEQQLELARHQQTARQKLHSALESRVADAQRKLENLNAEPRRPLDSVNPTAELAAQLSQQAAEMSGQLAKQLQAWQTSQLAPAQATAGQLSQAQQQEKQIARTVTEAALTLSRAARHEQRLQHNEVGGKFQQVAEATHQLGMQELQQVAEQLLQAQAQTRHEPRSVARAPAAATSAVLASSELAAAAIGNASRALRQLLEDNQTSSVSAPPADSSGENAQRQPTAPSSIPPTAAPPLNAAQKARLLDELDQQLNGQQNFGEKEDSSQPAPSGGSSGEAPSGTLADAAEQIAQGLSQSRQSATPPAATADLGMATQSLKASSEPQPPVAVRIIDVERRGGQWGELRQQVEPGLVETRRQTIAPRFRKQTEAYFRELAEQGALGSSE